MFLVHDREQLFDRRMREHNHASIVSLGSARVTFSVSSNRPSSIA